MADENTDLRCYLTNAGIAAENNSIQLNRSLNVTEMVFGSGLLADEKDPREQTAMIKEEYAVPCALLFDEDTPTLLVFKGDLPADVGGFYINEVGIRLEDGTIYGYARGKGDYKPTLEQGATDSVRYAVEMYSSNADNVVAKIDLSSVYADYEDIEATKKYADDKDAAHVASADPHTQYLKKTEKALAANIADTIGVTNLNRASSGVVTITSAAWFGAQPIGLSSMVQLNNVYLPVSVGSGYGYIFKLNARDISGGSAWLFMDNIKPPAKLWLGIAHDITSSPNWVSLYSSGNLPAISNVVGLSDALSGLSQSLQDHANALDPHHYYDEGCDYHRGEIVTMADNGYLKQFLCNQAHESNAAVNPINDDSDTWRQYPFKEINNANGRAFLYADGTCVQFGTYTHNQGAGSVERSFPVPFTSTKSILPGSFTDGGGATYLCGISFVGLSGYRTAINVYFSPTGTMYTNSTNNTPLISWVALGRWAEEV
ncbi:hypothetical protein DXJ57_02655 [Vibrio fluvialis]|nr:hypothetical protein [Vibrio fluvialis]